MRYDRRWPPLFTRLKRGPQVILPKDSAMIIVYAQIGKDSVVFDAGTGSGWLAVQLGRVAKKVISFEKREEFAKIAQKNIEKVGLENVEVRIRDVIEDGFDSKNADAIILDMASSDKAVGHAYDALKPGGVLAGYLPHTEQLRAFVEAAKETGFDDDVFCIECQIRRMLVRESGVRPENSGITHTGYLAFARKK